MSAWDTRPRLDTDEAFADTLARVFEDIYRRYFAEEEMLVNHGLPVTVRAVRQVEGWRVCLLLTPWMLARIFSAREDPEVTVPDDWNAARRADAPYVVIGPAVSFNLLGTPQKAHLNYEPRLGHYLVQPLVQTMDSYTDARQVFEAWNDVIRQRDETRRRLERDCPWQEEVSRREFFTRYATARAPE